MTQKTTGLTPEESAIANRDLKGAQTPAAGTAPVVKADDKPVHKTHASSKPGDPNISEDDTLKNAGSPYKDINFGNRGSMDE